MAIRLAVLFLLIFSKNTMLAQQVLSGKIIDQENGSAVVGASIFINNTTIGTKSDAEGVFSIANVPDGKHELVIRYVGYEIVSYWFTSSQLPLTLTFKLKQKTNQLQEIVISGGFKDVTNDPQYWASFERNFIGRTPFADRCSIENIKDIELRLYEKKGAASTLTAVAKRPIIIINRALGYRIEYDLESYKSTGFTRFFTGKAYFEELKDKKPSDRKLKLREAAYFGSVTHFLRSIYHQSLDKEGFEIRSILLIPHTEKLRYNAILNSDTVDKTKVRDFVLRKNNNLFGDSTDRIRAIIQRPDTEVISDSLIREKNLTALNKNGNLIFHVKDSLFAIKYKRPLPAVISSFLKHPLNGDKSVSSKLKISPTIEFVINPQINGTGRGIGFNGFFATFYGVSTMLPQDYQPSVKQ